LTPIDYSGAHRQIDEVLRGPAITAYAFFNSQLNGFAALGLMENLAALSTNHAARASVLDVCRRLMRGMTAQQAPDGMWRQGVDIPGS
jgi:rhamnogalacturonyl hydrolase YesR